MLTVQCRSASINCSVRGVCHCAAPINEVCEETAQAGREARLRLIRAIHHKNPEKKPSDIRTELQHLLPECQTVFDKDLRLVPKLQAGRWPGENGIPWWQAGVALNQVDRQNSMSLQAACSGRIFCAC